MTDDPKLGGELRAEAAELSQVARRLGAALPAQVSGTDGSGQVEVILGSGGFPEHIHVRAGWNQHVEPAQLGAAVTDAAQHAARTASQHRSANLRDNGWPQHARAGMSPRGAADARRPMESDLAAVLQGGQVRDVNELAEAVIRALQDAAAVSERAIAQLEQPPTSEGADDSGHVHVTIEGAQLAGCRVDATWAARKDGNGLSVALSQAARRAVAALPKPEPGPGDGLLADVLATQRHENQQQAGPGGAGPYRQEPRR